LFASVFLNSTKSNTKNDFYFLNLNTGRGKNMKKLIFTLFALVFTFGFQAQNASAQMSGDNMSGNKMMNGNPMVGGAAMFKNKDIIDNAVNSKDHTTLVAAVKAAGLVETLKGKGPFTVFAPTNSAFDALPAGTVETVLRPENKAMLTKVLTYHVVAGKMDSKAIMKAIKKGNGRAMLTTVSGDTLTASMSGNTLVLTDEKGGMSRVTIANVKQSNGVIHVVDTVLMPS
jgi:uncharacterized surface protein with fasciclin (FAS1) repeats